MARAARHWHKTSPRVGGTEIDYLNGYVIRKGREAGVPTPFNEAIVALTEKVESGVLESMVDNIWLVMDYPPE